MEGLVEQLNVFLLRSILGNIDPKVDTMVLWQSIYRLTVDTWMTKPHTKMLF